MFNVNDRVSMSKDYAHFENYGPDDICTVTKVHYGNGNDGDETAYAIVSDTDPNPEFPLWVFAEDIIHVTNVPAVAPAKAATRTFDTGATRDTDEGKLDFEGFLSPLVLKAFAEYMHDKRRMPDGSLRASDNWQLGIPKDAYMKSMWRHFFDVWTHYRTMKHDPGANYVQEITTELLALFFNVQGMLHEVLKAKHAAKGR